jgi:carboxyl-terminal processing protease
VAAFNQAKGEGAQYDGIGSLKLTIQKFYRINGGSTQLKGVTPDIELPDPYAYLDLGERKETSALPWDKIAAASYEPWKNMPPSAQLKSASQARIAANETFSLIAQTAQKLKDQQEHNIVPLNKARFEEKQNETKDLTEKMDKLDSMGGVLLVTNLKADLAKVNIDTASRSKNDDWLKTIKKDIYVYETTNVLNDWIRANAKVVQMEPAN